MKRNTFLKRFVSFVVALLMVVTMIDWSGFRVVAEAAMTGVYRICYYNPDWRGEQLLGLTYVYNGKYHANSIGLQPTTNPGTGWFSIPVADLDENAKNATAFIFKKSSDTTIQSNNFYANNFSEAVTYLIQDNASQDAGKVVKGGTTKVRDAYNASGTTTVFCYSSKGVATAKGNFALTDGLQVYTNGSAQIDTLNSTYMSASGYGQDTVNGKTLVKFTYSQLDASKAPLLFQATKSGESTKTNQVLITMNNAYVNLDNGKVYASKAELEADLAPTGGLKRVQYYRPGASKETVWKVRYNTKGGEDGYWHNLSTTATSKQDAYENSFNTGWFYADFTSEPDAQNLKFDGNLVLQFSDDSNGDWVQSDNYNLGTSASDDFYCVDKDPNNNTPEIALRTITDARKAYGTTDNNNNGVGDEVEGTTTVYVYGDRADLGYVMDGIVKSDGELHQIYDFNSTTELKYTQAEVANLDHEVSLKVYTQANYDASKKALVAQFHTGDDYSPKFELHQKDNLWLSTVTGKVYTSRDAFLAGEGLLKGGSDGNWHFYYYNPNVVREEEKNSGNEWRNVYLHYRKDVTEETANRKYTTVAATVTTENGWYEVTVPAGSIASIGTLDFYFSGLNGARGDSKVWGLWDEVTLDEANELKNTWRSDEFRVSLNDSSSKVYYMMDKIAMGDDLVSNNRKITIESDENGKLRIVTTPEAARTNFYEQGGSTRIHVYSSSSRTITGAEVTDGLGTVAATGTDDVWTVAGVDASRNPLNINVKFADAETGDILINQAEAYVNADTGVVYPTAAALEAGRNSTLRIKGIEVTSVEVTYGSNLTNGELQTVTTADVTVEQEDDYYKVTIPVDAANTYYNASDKDRYKGYQIKLNNNDSLVFGGKPVFENDDHSPKSLPDGLSKNDIKLEISGTTAKIENSVVAHYYNKSKWGTVYADVYAGSLKTADKVMSNVVCDKNGTWVSVDTGLNPADYPDGVYVVFKDGINSGSSKTKAYQFENSARVWVLPNMTMFRSQAEAEASSTSGASDNAVPANKVRVWFYHPGGWKNYYVGYTTGTTYSYIGMASSKQYPGWYSAVIPDTAKNIYFDEDQTRNNGSKESSVYDVTTNSMDTIFATANTKVLEKGWSVSSAEIARAYNLLACPESNALTLPVTFFDYQADNLFFEYDQTYLKNMTMVKGTNFNLYNQIGTTLFGTEKQVDKDGQTAGQEPTYDRNGELYSKGLIKSTLSSDGTIVYTPQAIEYIAETLYRGLQFNKENQGVKTYNRTERYETMLENKLYTGGIGSYTETIDKKPATLDSVTTCMDYAYYITSNLFRSSEVAKDYGMYDSIILQRTNKNIYSFYGNYQTDSDTGKDLVQNKTIKYEPYDFKNGTKTGSGSIRNEKNGQEWSFAQTGISGNGESRPAFNGYAGFFPLHKELMDFSFGEGSKVGEKKGAAGATNTYKYYRYNIPNLGEQTVEFTDNAYLKSWFRKDNTWQWDTDLVNNKAYPINSAHNGTTYIYDSVDYYNRNYHYGMKSSGKFRYDKASDLYFTFTGDDDVFLFIDGQAVMELGAAHAAASYTVYLNDLVDFKDFNMVDGQYYDFDFFYMERHTEWSNIRIETNIDVIDVSGNVVKECYYGSATDNQNVYKEPGDTAPTEGTLIPSGGTVRTGTSVTYSFSLTAGPEEGLSRLNFVDESLGIYLYADENTPNVYGSYRNPAYNPENPTAGVPETLPRTLSDLTVTIDGVKKPFSSEAELKSILRGQDDQNAINGGSTITISGIKWTMDETTTGPVDASMYSNGVENDLTSSYNYTVYVESPAIEVTKAVYDSTTSEDLDGSFVKRGETVTYSLTLENKGTSNVTDLKLVDDVLECGFSYRDEYGANRGSSAVKTEEPENSGNRYFVAYAENDPYTFSLSQNVSLGSYWSGTYCVQAEIVPLDGAQIDKMEVIVRGSDGSVLKTIDVTDQLNSGRTVKINEDFSGRRSATIEFVGDVNAKGVTIDNVMIRKKEISQGSSGGASYGKNLVVNGDMSDFDNSGWPWLPNSWKATYDYDGDNYFKLNEYTKVEDLTIIVSGTGMQDDIYTFETGATTADLNAVLAKVMNTVYPTGASITIAGIKYPVNVPVFPSDVLGSAKNIEEYSMLYDKTTHRNLLESFVKDYVDNNLTSIPEGYFDNAGYKELDTGEWDEIEEYILEYAQFVKSLQDDNGGNDVNEPNISNYSGLCGNFGTLYDSDDVCVFSYENTTDIEVTKQAYELGKDVETAATIEHTYLPNGSVLHYGELAGYEITLRNATRDAVTDLTLVDNDLEVKFGYTGMANTGKTNESPVKTETHWNTEAPNDVAFTAWTAADPYTFELVQEVTGLEAGNQYTLSADFKMLGGAAESTNNMAMNIVKPNGEVIATMDIKALLENGTITVDNMQKQQLTFTVPEGVGTVSVEFAGDFNKSGVMIDNISLVKKDSADNLIKNGDMSSRDESGWPFLPNDWNVWYGDCFELNEYTEISDLVITVEGINEYENREYTFDENATRTDLNRVLNRVMNQTYPAGASVTISGIKYPVNEPVFPSTVNGTALGAEGYALLKDKAGNDLLAAYVEAYIANPTDVTPATSAALAGATYRFLASDKKAEIEEFIDAYAKYMNGETAVYPDITRVSALFSGRKLEDDATVVLGARKQEFEYYSEAGTPINPVLSAPVKEVDVTPGEEGHPNTAMITNVTFDEGYHTITVFGDVILDEDTPVTVKKQNGEVVETAVPAVVKTVTDGETPYVTVSIRIDNNGDEKYETNVAPAQYTIIINDTKKSVTGKMNVTIDSQPEDYRIVKVEVTGEGDDMQSTVTLLPEDVKTDTRYEYTLVDPETDADGDGKPDGVDITAAVENSNLYPQITYTSNTKGDYEFYLWPKDAEVYSEIQPVKVKVHTYKLNNDVYVLDYGLKVELSKQDTQYNKNGMFANDEVTISGVTTEASYFGLKKDKPEGTPSYVADRSFKTELVNTGNAAELVYGNVVSTPNTDAANYAKADVTYTMNKFMEGIDTFHYGAQVAAEGATVKNVETATPVMYAKVTILPATIVYYEDSFGEIVTTGESASDQREQMTQGNGLDTQYGYDGAYSGITINNQTFNNTTSAGGVTTLTGTQMYAFTFTGTGLDIMTSTSYANMYTRIYKVTVDEEGTPDTILNPINKIEGNRYSYISVLKGGKAATPYKQALVNVYNENATLNQIPALSMRNLDENNIGTYIVLIQRMGGKEALQIDGIRIYNPMNYKDAENNWVDPAIGEGIIESEIGEAITPFRDLIFGGGYSFTRNPDTKLYETGYTKPEDIQANLLLEKDNSWVIGGGSTVVEWFTDTVTASGLAGSREQEKKTSSDLIEYALSGPNNELYMQDADHVFATVVEAGTNDFIQIGAKVVGGTNETRNGLKIEYLVNQTDDTGKVTGTEWITVPGTENLNTATERYYRIELGKLPESQKTTGRKVLMVRANGTGIVSFTNVKHTDGVNFYGLDPVDLGSGTLQNNADATVYNTKGKFTASTGDTGSVTLTFNLRADIEAEGNSIDVSYDGNSLFAIEEGGKLVRGTACSIDTSEDNLKVFYRKVGEVTTFVVKITAGKSGDYKVTAVTSGQAAADPVTITAE